MPTYQEFSTHFIQAMVASMYRFEAHLTNNPNLLTKSEEDDVYRMFCGFPK